MMRLAAAHIFSPHQAIIIMTLMSAGVLAAAYWFEYFGGLQPCTMCYWQRIPHAVVIGIGVVTFWLGDRYEDKKFFLSLGQCLINGICISLNMFLNFSSVSLFIIGAGNPFNLLIICGTCS